MKRTKKISIIVLSVLIIYLSVYIGFRNYVENNKNIKFLNKEYTQVDFSSSDFVPFGADNSWYRSDIGYYKLFGLSFLKNDRERNIIYFDTVLGSTVFVNDNYELPDFPSADVIDELIVFCDTSDGNKNVTITNRSHIQSIVNYLSDFKASADEQRGKPIVFYGVSNELGGVYQLNERGSIYIRDNNIEYGSIITGELPENVKDIIKLYINS